MIIQLTLKIQNEVYKYDKLFKGTWKNNTNQHRVSCEYLQIITVGGNERHLDWVTYKTNI